MPKARNTRRKEKADSSPWKGRGRKVASDDPDDDDGVQLFAQQLRAAAGSGAGNPQELSLCAHALQYASPRVRELAADTLAERGADPEARARAASYGSPAIEALAHALECDHADVRIAAARALAQLVRSQAVGLRAAGCAGRALAAALSDESMPLREAAAAALASIFSPLATFGADGDFALDGEADDWWRPIADGVLELLRAGGVSEAGRSAALDLCLYATCSVYGFAELAIARQIPPLLIALAEDEAGVHHADVLAAVTAIDAIGYRHYGDVDDNPLSPSFSLNHLLTPLAGAAEHLLQHASGAQLARALSVLSLSAEECLFDNRDIDADSARDRCLCRALGSADWDVRAAALRFVEAGVWSRQTALLRLRPDDSTTLAPSMIQTGALAALTRLIVSSVEASEVEAADRPRGDAEFQTELDELGESAVCLLAMLSASDLDLFSNAFYRPPIELRLFEGELPRVLARALRSCSRPLRHRALCLLRLLHSEEFARVAAELASEPETAEAATAYAPLHLPELGKLLLAFIGREGSCSKGEGAHEQRDVTAALKLLPHAADSEALVRAGAAQALFDAYREGHWVPPIGGAKSAPDAERLREGWCCLSQKRLAALRELQSVCYNSKRTRTKLARSQDHDRGWMACLAAALHGVAHTDDAISDRHAEAAFWAATILLNLLAACGRRAAAELRRSLVRRHKLLLPVATLAARFSPVDAALAIRNSPSALLDSLVATDTKPQPAESGDARARSALLLIAPDHCAVTSELAACRKRERVLRSQLAALAQDVGPPTRLHDLIFRFPDGRELGASRLLLARTDYYRRLLGDGPALQPAEAATGVVHVDASFSFEAYEALLRRVHSANAAPLPKSLPLVIELSALAAKLAPPDVQRPDERECDNSAPPADPLGALADECLDAIGRMLSTGNCIGALELTHDRPERAKAHTRVCKFVAAQLADQMQRGWSSRYYDPPIMEQACWNKLGADQPALALALVQRAIALRRDVHTFERGIQHQPTQPAPAAARAATSDDSSSRSRTIDRLV